MTKHQRRTVHGGAGILACALALAASGCGGGGGANPQIGAHSSVTLADRLTLALSEDKQNAATGKKVTFQITLTNPTAAPITSVYAGYGPLTSAPDPQANSYGLFLVRDSSGGAIGADGGPFMYLPLPPPQNRTYTLQPGQSLYGTVVYTFSRTGVYTTTAALQNPDLSPTPAAGPLTVFIQ